MDAFAGTGSMFSAKKKLLEAKGDYAKNVCNFLILKENNDKPLVFGQFLKDSSVYYLKCRCEIIAKHTSYLYSKSFINSAAMNIGKKSSSSSSSKSLRIA